MRYNGSSQEFLCLCYLKSFIVAALNRINTAEQQPLKNDTIIDIDCEVKDVNPPLIERR